MKKIYKRSNSPAFLEEHLRNNPNGTWVQFRDVRDGYKEVVGALRTDQRNVCAYCENTFTDGINGLPDFSVEHFHPKTPHNPPPNYSLLWTNLLGVCKGGNARDVDVRERFTLGDYSCDVPKEDFNLTDQILNPISDIPAFPPIFDFDEDGRMAVAATCPEPLFEKANVTIDKLRLSPENGGRSPQPRLIRFRKSALSHLKNQIEQEMIKCNGSLGAALDVLSQIYFDDNPINPYPAFFSCIRWYLGPAAEKRLREINFNG